MKDPTRALKKLSFRWLPKHIQHIAENIIFDQRNISFLAINALFRQTQTHKIQESDLKNNHFLLKDFVPFQPNDRIRTLAEELAVVFYIDEYDNIVVITAYSENDKLD